MATPFWVIFDTSQFPDYYRDVHNLLANPPAATMRYDYKAKYLSRLALELAGKTQPVPILFVYTQKRGAYAREEGRSVAPRSVGDVMYIATRIGTMLNVTKTSETYYFDFQLTRYPATNSAVLGSIIEPLRNQGEVPWASEKDGWPGGKWVSVSEEIESYERLTEGDDQQNWSNIVSQMAVSPVQFAHDSFWRLKGPYKSGGDIVHEPQISYETEGGQTRKAEATYSLPENGVWRFEVISEVGRGTGSRPLYSVEVSSTDEKAMKPVGNATVGLRRSTGEMINFRTETAALMGTTFVHFTMATQPQPSEWVVGPNVNLKFRVHRNRLRVSLGIVFGMLGALGFTAGGLDVLKTQHPWWGAGCQFAGIIAGSLSLFFLTGKITFEAK